MKRNELVTADIAALVRDYRVAAMRHGSATEMGEHRKANLSGQLARYTLTCAAVALMRNALFYPFWLIRLLAYGYGPGRTHLSSPPEQGEAALEALTNLDRFLGLSAEMTLKEWRRSAPIPRVSGVFLRLLEFSGGSVDDYIQPGARQLVCR